MSKAYEKITIPASTVFGSSSIRWLFSLDTSQRTMVDIHKSYISLVLGALRSGTLSGDAYSVSASNQECWAPTIVISDVGTEIPNYVGTWIPRVLD